MTDHTPTTIRVRCPRCYSRLDVMETQSGARTVSVAGLGPSVEENAISLEHFFPPDAGPELICPACGAEINPSSSRVLPPVIPRPPRRPAP